MSLDEGGKLHNYWVGPCHGDEAWVHEAHQLRKGLSAWET